MERRRIPQKKVVSTLNTPNYYTLAIDSLIQSIIIYQILLQKDNFHIMSNCTFGDNLFLCCLLQRRQKPSLLGKGLSTNVTTNIICSSHIDWLKRVVARWHQKRADILSVTHLLLYHDAGNRLRTLSILALMFKPRSLQMLFIEFLKVFTLSVSVRNNRRH